MIRHIINYNTYLNYLHISDKQARMSTLDSSLQVEWQRKINSSPEVKQARLNMEFHKRKMRQLHEELTSAEVWETELEERLSKVQEKVKPSLMKFSSQLEREEGVDEDVIEETMADNVWEKILSVLKKRMVKVEQMERSELLGLVKTVLDVRSWLAEKDCQMGVEAMQEMARLILKQMGRSTIDWMEMKEWELKVVRLLIREVEGVPGFMARMVDQLLGRLVGSSRAVV